MILFIVKRVLTGFVLILAISFFTFMLMYSGGSDFARNILGPEADQAQVDGRARELGLDQPIIAQYIAWLTGVVRGDLGTSWLSTETVAGAVADRFSMTLSVVSVSIVIVAALSITLGIIAAVRRGWLDRFVQVLSVVGIALPNFWIAMVLVVVFAIGLQVLPATGYTTPGTDLGGWALSITLPVIALVVGGIAAASQQIRSAVIDVLRQDYIRTLKARGLSTRTVLLRHTLKNAIPPALTVLSLQFIAMMGGAVVIEKVFALPGVGMLAVMSTLRGDVPMVMGVVMTMAALVVVVNLIIDLANGWANPKARTT